MRTRKDKLGILIGALIILAISCPVIVLCYEDVINKFWLMLYMPLTYLGFILIAEAFKI